MWIDEAAVAARVAARRQQEYDGVDLWVRLDGADRLSAAADLRMAADREAGGPDEWRIVPTSSGTYAWLCEARSWRSRVAGLARELELLGHAGSIGVTAIDPWRSDWAERPFPTVMLVHRVDPSPSEGPRNVYGQPMRRWGVGAEANQRLLAFASEWINEHGIAPAIGPILHVPVTTDDAPEILAQTLERKSGGLLLASQCEESEGPRRVMSFAALGTTAWTDLDDQASAVELALRGAQLATRFAPELVLAVVHPTFAGIAEFEDLTTGLWSINQHLRSSFVPDAFGIQLLTDRHLDRARDLSHWQVDEVSPARFLVQARDLSGWFEAPHSEDVKRGRFPDPELRDQARADFGEMILTQESAAAHPLVPPSL